MGPNISLQQNRKTVYRVLSVHNPIPDTVLPLHSHFLILTQSFPCTVPSLHSPFLAQSFACTVLCKCSAKHLAHLLTWKWSQSCDWFATLTSVHLIGPCPKLVMAGLYTRCLSLVEKNCWCYYSSFHSYLSLNRRKVFSSMKIPFCFSSEVWKLWQQTYKRALRQTSFLP